MVLARYYNPLRLGKEGHRRVAGNMLAKFAIYKRVVVTI